MSGTIAHVGDFHYRAAAQALLNTELPALHVGVPQVCELWIDVLTDVRQEPERGANRLQESVGERVFKRADEGLASIVRSNQSGLAAEAGLVDRLARDVEENAVSGSQDCAAVHRPGDGGSRFEDALIGRPLVGGLAIRGGER